MIDLHAELEALEKMREKLHAVFPGYIIRKDAKYLARVLEVGDTSLEFYGRKIATENRPLTPAELKRRKLRLGKEICRSEAHTSGQI
jgi:hypothetical protein